MNKYEMLKDYLQYENETVKVCKEDYEKETDPFKSIAKADLEMHEQNFANLKQVIKELKALEIIVKKMVDFNNAILGSYDDYNEYVEIYHYSAVNDDYLLTKEEYKFLCDIGKEMKGE